MFTGFLNATNVQEIVFAIYYLQLCSETVV